MYIEEIKRGLRGEIKKRENEQYCTCETNIRQMCKDVLAKIEEQESVIAELKNKINEAQTELELWRDGSIISEAHQKELDGKRHSDYKRCLAMADKCAEAYNRECGLNPEEMTDKEFYKQQIEFWPRWNSKWLKIAEKFKEAKCR